MKLLVQPEDGLAPLLNAVRTATTSIHIVVFRFDLPELEEALGKAVTRGVSVNALIANTNRGGEKRLRKLEQRLLDAGVSVTRTADDLARYHGKVMIADKTLFVLGFNYTHLDIERSRSFGVATTESRVVKAAIDLFESDASRQPYKATEKGLIVSPENARDCLEAFIQGAKRSLYIYDMNVTDKRMIKLLAERQKAGVDVRIIGKASKLPDGIGLSKLVKLRLHARAIIRDGTRAFVGSQSLKRNELDNRREVGIIIPDPRIAKRLQRIFEEDWENAKTKQEPELPETTGKAKGKLALVAS
jgi:phosphatidylserine/phosphatidylglycerophosphate/cardiolipin synthase-like enzyme